MIKYFVFNVLFNKNIFVQITTFITSKCTVFLSLKVFSFVCSYMIYAIKYYSFVINKETVS